MMFSWWDRLVEEGNLPRFFLISLRMEFNPKIFAMFRLNVYLFFLNISWKVSMFMIVFSGDVFVSFASTSTFSFPIILVCDGRRNSRKLVSWKHSNCD